MSEKVLQDWFEMKEVRKPRLSTATWVPLFTRKVNSNELGYCEEGFREEFYLAIGIILPVGSKERAFQLPWMHVRRNPDNRPWMERGLYNAADMFIDRDRKLKGVYPVLEQSFDGAEPKGLHLNQDLVLGLGLLREGDTWVRPAEDYLDVVRLFRDKNGEPETISIRSEHLRDYLAARRSGLLVTSFRSRRGVFGQKPSFDWTADRSENQVPGGTWKGFVQEIDESGSPYGSEVAVFTTWRTDVDYRDDVPVFSFPDDTNIAGTNRTFKRAGKKLYFVMGEMWQKEWIEPARRSPRVRGDRIDPSVSFIIDTSGTTAVANQLINETRWLWFRPSVITEILKRRGAKLCWYSRNTGAVGLPCHSPIHFGVNSIGIVNVFAKDIGLLPEFVQKLWAGHNVSPDGPVSPELLSAQMECKPARTKAPEYLLTRSLFKLEQVSKEHFGESILRQHPIEARLLLTANRFLSVDLSGVCQLCKEINRLAVDRLNVPLLKRLTPGASEEIGSIKRLANLLDRYGADGRGITKALVGVYELRHADAHLPPEDLTDALALLDIEGQGNFLEKGKVVLLSVGEAIEKIADPIALAASRQQR